MLTKPATRPPSAQAEPWRRIASGPAVWWALAGGFSAVLLIVASASQPDESIELTALAAAIVLTAAFGFRLRSGFSGEAVAESGIGISIATAAAFEIGTLWIRFNGGAWPPPAWLTFALLLAAAASFAAAAAMQPPRDLRIALAESLLPASLLAFVALFAAPDFSFRSLGNESGVWIVSGLAIALWFGASALSPSSIPFACGALGCAAVLLGLLAGNQTAVALGNISLMAYGLAVIAFRDRARSEERSYERTGRFEHLLPPTVVALAFIALALHAVSNPHRQTALHIAAAAAFVLLVARQVALLWRQRDLLDRLDAARRELARRAALDTLTGLPNRDALIVRLDEEMERARRFDQAFSVCFVDVDHFKAINDRFGHAAGDIALREIGLAIRRIARLIDFVGRYGGEEFLVIAPNTNLADALVLGERLRAAIESHPVLLGNGEPIDVTISAGLAEYPVNAATVAALVEQADIALYESKRAGRNRVTASTVVEAV